MFYPWVCGGTLWLSVGAFVMVVLRYISIGGTVSIQLVTVGIYGVTLGIQGCSTLYIHELE